MPLRVDREAVVLRPTGVTPNYTVRALFGFRDVNFASSLDHRQERLSRSAYETRVFGKAL